MPLLKSKSHLKGERVVGLKSALEFPGVYQWAQEILGGRNAHRHFVTHHLRPKVQDRILDIGCGPAQILEVMPRDVQYFGVDLNPRYISAAKARYQACGTFHCQSVSEMLIENKHSFDLVMAHGLIHHLEDGEALQLFQIAAQALKPGGRFLTVDGCYTENQSRIARWMLDNDRGQYVRREPEYLALARQSFAEVQSTVRHDLLRTPYTHIILDCQAPKASVAPDRD